MAQTSAQKQAAARQKRKTPKEKKVPTFVYKGVDRKGNKVSGEIDIASSAMAKAALKKQGITTKSVGRKLELPFGTAKIKPMDVAIFSRQLATMMKAGVPLIQSFDIVSEGLDNQAMKALVKEIKADVSSGGGLAVALRKHPKYFDELFCNLVESGEQSGALETMLDRVATYKEKTEALKAKIKKAMNYPIGVVSVAVIVTAILMIKVVPVFAEMFESFGAELPAFTQIVVAISEWVQAYWWIVGIGLVLTIVAHKEASLRSEKYRDTIDAFALKAPVVSGIVHSSVYARFARTLSTTFAAGVPLVDALESVAGAAGNIIYKKGIMQVREEVMSGTTLYSSMKSKNLFPSMMLQMISIGEESGSLDAMLSKVATFYEDEVDNAVDGLTALMEPLIMSVLGVLVGGLMIAMYLPIFAMGSAV